MIADLDKKNMAELQELLEVARVKLGKLRFEMVNQSVKDTSQIGKTRKEIARILTAVNGLKKHKIKTKTR